MIKAITFDLDGVYFPSGSENFVKAIINLGISEEEARRVFINSDEMLKIYKVGKWTDEEFWTWAAREWNLNKTPEELINLLIKGYEVDPKVVATIKKVRKNGYQALICSNTFPARVAGLQKKFGFLDNFDTAILSYEVGATKPDKKIFEALVEKSGVKPAEIVFADDREKNLVGAKEAGITTFLYQGFDEFTDHLRKLGVNL